MGSNPTMINFALSFCGGNFVLAFVFVSCVFQQTVTYWQHPQGIQRSCEHYWSQGPSFLPRGLSQSAEFRRCSCIPISHFLPQMAYPFASCNPLVTVAVNVICPTCWGCDHSIRGQTWLTIGHHYPERALKMLFMKL